MGGKSDRQEIHKSHLGEIKMEIEGYMFPEDLYYSDQFLWVRIESDNLAIIGLNELAVKAVKEFALIEIFFPAGYEIVAGKPVGASDSWKGSLTLYSPISGKIVEVNQEVEYDPRLVITDPYGAGWFFKVSPTNLLAEKEALMKGGSPELVKWVKNTITKIV
ncbi:MAG: glycine cleavage system protein H [Promethearchaeota archaeon]